MAFFYFIIICKKCELKVNPQMVEICCALSSVAECSVHIGKVVGSIPTGRTTLEKSKQSF